MPVLRNKEVQVEEIVVARPQREVVRIGVCLQPKDLGAKLLISRYVDGTKLFQNLFVSQTFSDEVKAARESFPTVM